VAVAALAMLFVQQQKLKELRQENETLKQQAAQVAPLQAQLAGAAQTAAGAAAAQEEQTRELARLRNEVSRLHGQTNELARARQEIQTLHQRVVSETEARKDEVAAVQAAARISSSAGACINNLRLLDASKQQWALENKKQNTDTPTLENLRPYLGRGTNGELPVCPDGGVYTIGAVGEKPTCSLPGHALP